jgi:hypothetical protein
MSYRWTLQVTSHHNLGVCAALILIGMDVILAEYKRAKAVALELQGEQHQNPLSRWCSETAHEEVWSVSKVMGESSTLDKSSSSRKLSHEGTDATKVGSVCNVSGTF